MMSENDTAYTRQLHLQVQLPTGILVDQEVTKVIAVADNGEFCLLPRHIDFVTALVPGILSFWTEKGEERYAAVDKGVLVKCGHDVFVSVLNGVQGADLSQLQALVEERYLELDEHERKTRTALARLEAGTLRRFRELQEQSHG